MICNVWQALREGRSAPEVGLALCRHSLAAAWAGMSVPYTYVVGAATRAEPAAFAAERRGYVAYYASHHQGLHAVALMAHHHRYVLIEEAAALIHINTISAAATAAGLFA